MRIFIDITSDQSGGNFVPAAVKNVQAQDMGSTIQVSWDEFEVVNEERDGVVVKYVVEKKVNDGNWSHMFDFTEEDWATGFFFYDIERSEGNTYNYRIKAVTTLSKETDWSKVATIEIEEETPATVPGIVSHPANPETSFNYIKFNWSVPDDGGSAITGYAIRRDGVIIENNWPTNEYIDLDAPNGNLIYNFAAINSVGQGGWSADKATQLRGWSQNTLVISSSRIDITINGPWQSMSTPHSWDIQRSIDNSNWVTIATDQTGIYEDKGLTPDTLYFYRTVMKNEYGISPPSAVSSVRTLEEDEPSEVFNAPLLSAEIDIDNQNGIYTTWTPNPENTVAADYYEFEKIEEDGSPSISGAFSGAGGTAKDSSVTAGKVYKYRCRGHHSVHGYTPWSDQVTINLIYLNREYDYTYPSPVQDVALGAAYVYFPEAYRKNPEAEFPVIVYCHGQGERAGGTSPNFTTLANGAGFTKELRGKSNEIPVIAICPQVVGWGSFATEGMIDECVAAVISGLGLPLQHKFVLSGYSAGGNDTWPYVRDHDNTNVVGFIPFGCRLYIPSGNAQVQDYLDRELPTWIFHNINDTTQEPTNHIGFLNTVFTLDPDNDFIRGTIYDLSGHDPVTRTINTLGGDVVEGYYPYNNAGNELYDWIADVYFGNIP